MSQAINDTVNFDKDELALFADAVDMIVPSSPLPDFDNTIINEPKSVIDCGRDSPRQMDDFLAVIELDNIDMDKVGEVFGVDDEVEIVNVTEPDNAIDKEYLNKIRYGPSGIPASEAKVERESRDGDRRQWQEVDFAKYMSFYDRDEVRSGKKLRFIGCGPNMNQRFTRKSVVPTTGANNTVPPGSPGAFDEPLILSEFFKKPTPLVLATASNNIVKPTHQRPTPIQTSNQRCFSTPPTNQPKSPVAPKYANKRPKLQLNLFRCKIDDIIEYVPELNRRLPASQPAPTSSATFDTSTIGQMYEKFGKHEVDIKNSNPKKKKQSFKLANPGFDIPMQTEGLLLSQCARMEKFCTKSSLNGQIFRWAPAVKRNGKNFIDKNGNILYISEDGYVGTWMAHNATVYTRSMTLDTQNQLARFTFENTQKKVNVLVEYAHKKRIFD